MSRELNVGFLSLERDEIGGHEKTFLTKQTLLLICHNYYINQNVA